MARKRKHSKNSAHKKTMARVRAQRGLDRDHFFANGGEMVRWRGLHLVQQDKKKRANKRFCRKKARV